MNEAKAPESTVDLIVCWPDNCDYPLWREFVKVHRDYFAKVIVVFTKTNQGDDYREFVRKVMADDNITFLESRPVTGDQDWRDVAVNQALEVSTGMWVWFTEQDFFVTNAAFWAMIGRFMLEKDAIGYKDGATRLHPSCLFVKRSFINQTGKFFGIVPNKLDHFARFYTSLRLTGAKIMEIPREVRGVELWYHMNGLSHNMSLLKRGEPITYKPDEFLGYLQLCLNDSKNLDPRFRKQALAGVKTLEAQIAG